MTDTLLYWQCHKCLTFRPNDGSIWTCVNSMRCESNPPTPTSIEEGWGLPGESLGNRAYKIGWHDGYKVATGESIKYPDSHYWQTECLIARQRVLILEPDATRYKWLREQTGAYPKSLKFNLIRAYRRDGLDRAIDAAIREEKGGAT